MNFKKFKLMAAATKAATPAIVTKPEIVVPHSVYGIRLRDYSLDEGAVELGAFCVASTICMFLMLDKLRGRPGKLSNWLLFRKLEIFKNEAHNTERVTNFMYFAMMAYLVMPIFILVMWSLLIIYDNSQEDVPLTAGLCILIVGLGVILFVTSILKVKWNNFRFKVSNMILMLSAFILITIYQILVVFGHEYEEKFFPYSALFLNFNVFILALAIYLSKFDKDSDMKSIFDKAFPPRNIQIDPRRENDLMEEIEA